ncbi:hypothetical protein ACLB2K_019142 [Fragaria x ananassa]
MEMGGSDVAVSACGIGTPLQTKAMEGESSSPPFPLRCVHRVPDRFRREREKDYTPRVISIGPYHHKNQALKRMEVHKWWYLNCFMERSPSQSSHSQNDYIDKIIEQEEKLRKCYTETIELTRDEFVTMVLVDAIFLIEFLLRYQFDQLRDENDCIFGIPRMLPDVVTDLLMLENQLPLFILEDLLSLYNGESRGGAKRLAIMFLINQASDSLGVKLDTAVKLDTGVKLDTWVKLVTDYYSSRVKGQHFVDLLRNLLMTPLLEEEKLKGETLSAIAPSMTPRSEEEKLKGETLSPIAPCLEKLHLAGGKIHGETSILNMFAIRFDDNRILKSRILKNWIPKFGILKIPKLRIADPTELILRNLIAFEQCSMSKYPIICHYVMLMDMLVDSPKDVELLFKHKIVENALLGDDHELSSMINRLSKGIVCDTDFYYGALCGKMDKFCNSNWPKWIKNLRSIYFNTPWTTLSVVAAVVLLILTAIQTICSIYQTF